MGEVADDMIEGVSCSLCGIYFEEEHGYPVVCKRCWRDLKPRERDEYQKAIHREL